MPAKTSAIPSLHRDSFLAYRDKFVAVLSSGNTSSPYCRAVRIKLSFFRMENALAEGKERLIPEESPWYSETDIMEFPGHELNIIFGTIHCCSYDGTGKSGSGTWRGQVD